MMPDVIAAQADRLRSARLLVCTSLAYRPQRLQQWFEMVRCFADFPVAGLDMVMQVNTDDPDALANIEELCAVVRSPSKSFEAEVCVPPPHSPYDLCWAHKPHIARRFLGNSYTHFIYLEDDMRFGVQNFAYFLHYRDALEQHGLIPSFVRYEWSEHSRYINATDQTAPSNLAGRKLAECGSHRFVNLDNPYCAAFVLDRPLATEYIRSVSFGIAESEQVCDFGVPERAAMGLCFEAIPDGFSSRYVVPILSAQNQVATCAWIHHLTNTYASKDDPTNYFGRLRMDHLLRDDPAEIESQHTAGIKTRAHYVRWFRSGHP